MSAPADDVSSRPRRGRRPGASTTREKILRAARARFAKDGYSSTTIRKIAADAGVDGALVIQFFGSKDELFGAVMSVSPDALTQISAAFDGPADSLGSRVAETLLGLWEEGSPDSEALLAMVRGAIVNEQASELLRGFIQERLTDAGDAHARDDDMIARMGLASSMLIGVIVARRILRVPAIVDQDLGSIVAVVGPALQELLRPHLDE